MHPVDAGSALPATPARPAAAGRPSPPPETPGASGVRVGVVALYLFIAAMSLLQQPGRVTYDTRAELTQRPGGFLAEAFTLWHPESNFGEFQNQAYGYLFPQGSFFVLVDLVQLPDWVGQRLWSALVLVIACEGARRVGSALGMTAPVALLAGLAFAFSPRLLGTVSVITGESLPGAVLPWVLLPVLLALQRRMRGRRAVVLSGAAVVCMGGVNAVENLGALPLVAVVVAWGWRRGLLSRRFAGAWAGAVLLASAWWLLPLLVLAGYAPPFYEYVESAANTTALVGWSEATRGGSHWVAYLIVGDQAWWPAANELVSSPGLVLVSAVVAALGLWGLARFAHPLRRPLLLSALVGLAALTVAHGGWEGSPVSGQVRALLDGPLQVFRNVHKIDPTVRLPLAIGFAQAVALLLAAVVRRRPRWEAATGLLYVVPLLLVVSLGQPYLVNTSRTPGWEEISQPWQQAEAYLADHQDDRTTLVLPGSGFAHQTWGWTLDEPLQVLGGANRATRSQVPIIPGQSIRFLTALDQLASTGRADADLADQLARAGIGHVVIRRDLLRSLTGSPFPGGASVSAAVGGLEPVAGYGGLREGGFEVEVYEVPVTAPILRTTPLDDVLTVRGAPESILALQRQGLVDLGQATVLEGEPAWEGTAEVVTDADQRRERAFGVSDESVSAVMGADEPFRTDRAVHELPTVPHARQVVARYDGLRSLTASSSQGYADNFGPVVPQAGPYAAVDGDPETRWVTSSATRPDEQWLRLELDEPRSVSRVEVLPVVEDPTVVPIRTLEVRAGDQVRTIAASPSGAVSTATFDGSSVSSVEVRVRSAATGSSEARIGLREVTVDGLTPTRSLVVPGAGAPGTSWLFSTAPERRACALTVGTPDCEDRRIRGAEEPEGIDRTFTSGPGEAQPVEVRGTVVARATREAAQLLEPVRRRQVGATSVYGNDPRVSPRFAYDGEESTVWVSAEEDRGPTLFLEFGRRRTVSGLEVRTGEAGSAPVSAIVRSGEQARAVDVVEGELGRFRPLEGRSFQITFEVAPEAERVAIAELDLQGAGLTLPFFAVEPTGAVCGLGPRVVIDGTAVPTRVSGTLADVVNGTPMTFESCTPDDPDDTPRGNRDGRGRRATPPTEAGSVVLQDGVHRLSTVPTREFLVTEVAVVPAEPPPSVGSGARGIEVRTWGSSRRVAAVEAGPSSLLHLPENFNDGWVAEVDGERLVPLRVDGWQQGWVLPAGPAVEVTMTYRPQQLYAVVLPLGLAASGSLLLAGLALLVLGAARRLRAGRAPDGPDPDGPDPDGPDPDGPDPDGPVPDGPVPDGPAWGAEPPAPGMIVGLVLAPVALLTLGWAAVVGLLVGMFLTAPRRVPYAAALVVVAAVLDIQVSAAWSRSWGDALAAVGVGVVVGAVLVEPRTPTAGGRRRERALPRLPRLRLPRLPRLRRRRTAA